jgi:hypothetical protein
MPSAPEPVFRGFRSRVGCGPGSNFRRCLRAQGRCTVSARPGRRHSGRGPPAAWQCLPQCRNPGWPWPRQPPGGRSPKTAEPIPACRALSAPWPAVGDGDRQVDAFGGSVQGGGGCGASAGWTGRGIPLPWSSCSSPSALPPASIATSPGRCLRCSASAPSCAARVVQCPLPVRPRPARLASCAGGHGLGQGKPPPGPLVEHTRPGFRRRPTVD